LSSPPLNHQINHQKLKIRRTDPIIKSSTFEVPSAQSSIVELSDHQLLMVLQLLNFQRAGTPCPSFWYTAPALDAPRAGYPARGTERVFVIHALTIFVTLPATLSFFRLPTFCAATGPPADHVPLSLTFQPIILQTFRPSLPPKILPFAPPATAHPLNLKLLTVLITG
jgi:hypothetical protein